MEKLLQLVDHLDRLKHRKYDLSVLHAAAELRNRILHPMSDILEMIPAKSLSERARKIGVSRQTYYDWMVGKSRPNKIKAKRLSMLTGIPVEEIRAR
jgi:DNA-binding transcriptional regulator YiaG